MDDRPSQVYLAKICDDDFVEPFDLLPGRAGHSAHRLTGDPAEADLILLLGNFGLEPHLLLDHPLYRAYPDRCAVYTEDDHYLPLLPGVYCSARTDESHRCGRVSAYSYVSASGGATNPFVAVEAGAKKYLFTFLGGSTSLLRKRLFKHRFDRPDVLIENTSAYHHWNLDEPGREERQRRYARAIAESHFVLCPRGAGAGSIRLFEVMQAGVAPVLIADDYALPPHVPWDDFLIRVRERDLARLPALLEPHAATSAERGRLARAAWVEHFGLDKEFDAIVTACWAALRHGPPEEAFFRRQQARLVAHAKLRRRLRGLARDAALGALRFLRLKPPYEMNR